MAKAKGDGDDTFIPKSVKAQGDEADKKFDEINAKPEEEDVIDPKPPEPEPPEEPPKDPKDDDDDPFPTDKDGNLIEPSDNGIIIDEDDWQHKYNTLKGMMDENQRRDTDTIGRQEQMISQLIAAQERKIEEPPPESDPVPLPKKLNPDTYPEYDPYLHIVGETLHKLEQKLDQFEQRFQAVQGDFEIIKRDKVVVEQNSFESELTAAVKDWHIINEREDWKLWLIDPEYTKKMGERRQDVLKRAQVNQKPQPVINLFKEWKGLFIKPKIKKDISEEAIPNETSPAAPTNYSQEGNVVTLAEYNAAVDKAKRGKMTLEEFNKISDKYQHALSKGLA